MFVRKIVISLILVSIPIACSSKPEVKKICGKRYVSVEDYNSCVKESNECAERLEESDKVLKEAKDIQEESKLPEYLIILGEFLVIVLLCL